MKTKTLKEAQARYGEIAYGKWPDEAKWMVTYFVPPDIAPRWHNTASGVSTKKIYLNKDMLPALMQALDNVRARALTKELKTFDGCFSIRQVRGAASLSTHSYGLAIDINAKENALGAEPTMSPELVACFTDAGFTWGGNFRRRDGMHFQLADW